MGLVPPLGPSLARPMNIPFPVMTNVPLDTLHIPASAGAPGPYANTSVDTSQPLPVPKPRMPDSSDQQAYEAWIEWRKAHEPGYAMECKLRQQRRAQRGLVIKSTAPCATSQVTAGAI